MHTPLVCDEFCATHVFMGFYEVNLLVYMSVVDEGKVNGYFS